MAILSVKTASLVVAVGLASSMLIGSAIGNEAELAPIVVGNQAYSYQAALPILLKELRTSLERRFAAITNLERYGNALVGTEAFEQLLQIVDEKFDFSVIDSAEGKQRLADLEREPTSRIREALDVASVKSEALLTVVMTGDEAGLVRLRRFQGSPSETERKMAERAFKEREAFGYWTKGKVANKQPEPRITVLGQSVDRIKGIALLSKELKSTEPAHMAGALHSLTLAVEVLLKPTIESELFIRALAETEACASHESVVADERVQLVRQIIDKLGGLPFGSKKALLPFIERCARDSDEDIAELGSRAYAYLQRPVKRECD